jgi:hypothetical protein
MEAGMVVCTPGVYVDGAPVRETLVLQRSGAAAAVPLDDYVTPSEVRAVEVYRYPAQAPPQYQTSTFMGECPVLLVWTDWGFKTGKWRPQEAAH